MLVRSVEMKAPVSLNIYDTHYLQDGHILSSMRNIFGNTVTIHITFFKLLEVKEQCKRSYYDTFTLYLNKKPCG